MARCRSTCSRARSTLDRRAGGAGDPLTLPPLDGEVMALLGPSGDGLATTMGDGLPGFSGGR
jgi:hypothetical protein